MATKVKMTGTVKVNTALNVRNRPSYGGDIIKTIKNGTKLNITQIEGEWYYSTTTGGWSHSNYIILKNDENRTVAQNKSDNNSLSAEAAKKNNDSKINQGFAESQGYTTSSTDKEIVDSLIIHNLNGVYGIPYQFMENVDPRLGNSVMGRKYSEKIISKMPLLCITPGKVKFLSNYSKREKDGILAKLITGDSDSDIADILKTSGRYYTFEFAYNEYFKYVNSLCRIGARFLEIQDVKLNIGGVESKASNFDWGRALNKNLKTSIASSQEFIGFYMDSADSVTESFGNSTTQSQLASTLNGFSDTAKELNFLLGAGAGIQYDLMDSAKLGETLSTINSISDQYLRGNTLFKTIANNFATIATGGKLLFPEIWADSEFSRDFDITIKLRTPDCDTMSWYLNIFVPLCHLIALAAGHQAEHVNGYYTPFLVRAFYKGLFNVDMGIVTSMSIRKGKEAAWNIDGLPTEIDVDITIKDLYNMLTIAIADKPKSFVTNNLLMDYVANTCGINYNEMDITRSLEIYLILAKNSVTDIPNKIVRKFQDAIDTYAIDLYDAGINKFLI